MNGIGEKGGRLPIDENELEADSPLMNKNSPETTILSPIVNGMGAKNINEDFKRAVD